MMKGPWWPPCRLMMTWKPNKNGNNNFRQPNSHNRKWCISISQRMIQRHWLIVTRLFGEFRCSGAGFDVCTAAMMEWQRSPATSLNHDARIYSNVTNTSINLKSSLRMAAFSCSSERMTYNSVTQVVIPASLTATSFSPTNRTHANVVQVHRWNFISFPPPAREYYCFSFSRKSSKKPFSAASLAQNARTYVSAADIIDLGSVSANAYFLAV